MLENPQKVEKHSKEVFFFWWGRGGVSQAIRSETETIILDPGDGCGEIPGGSFGGWGLRPYVEILASYTCDYDYSYYPHIMKILNFRDY